jgi:hypothetical protein
VPARARSRPAAVGVPRSTIRFYDPTSGRGLERARVGLFGDHEPIDVLVGVETLAAAGYLIEVDATAVA